MTFMMNPRKNFAEIRPSETTGVPYTNTAVFPIAGAQLVITAEWRSGGGGLDQPSSWTFGGSGFTASDIQRNIASPERHTGISYGFHAGYSDSNRTYDTNSTGGGSQVVTSFNVWNGEVADSYGGNNDGASGSMYRYHGGAIIGIVVSRDDTGMEPTFLNSVPSTILYNANGLTGYEVGYQTNYDVGDASLTVGHSGNGTPECLSTYLVSIRPYWTL